MNPNLQTEAEREMAEYEERAEALVRELEELTRADEERMTQAAVDEIEAALADPGPDWDEEEEDEEGEIIRDSQSRY